MTLHIMQDRFLAKCLVIKEQIYTQSCLGRPVPISPKTELVASNSAWLP